MHTSLIQVISQIIRLNEEEKNIIAGLFVPKQFGKGEFFLKEGQVCREAGFIEKGLVRYFINNDGEERIYGFGKENDFVCNYESFLDHSASAKNIQVIENSNILVISYNNLQVLYERLQEGQKLGRLVCEQLFVEALRQITSLYADAPEQRYTNFLASYADLQQRIPQYYISSYVGIKPQSLSRIRKRLSAS